MPDYEIRLLDAENKTVMSYWIHGTSDESAKQTLATLDTVHYTRYEIWRDPDLVDSGYRSENSTASAA